MPRKPQERSRGARLSAEEKRKAKAEATRKANLEQRRKHPKMLSKDESAIDQRPHDTLRIGTPTARVAGEGYSIDAEGVVVPDEIDPDFAIHQVTDTETATEVEPRLRGSGLIADPDLRISLSAPRVRTQHAVSQAKLKALKDKLDEFRGEDEAPRPGENTEPVPLSEAELQLLRHVVAAAIELHKAPALPGNVIESLRKLYEYLASMETMAKSLQIVGLIEVLGQAVLGLKGFLVALGVL